LSSEGLLSTTESPVLPGTLSLGKDASLALPEPAARTSDPVRPALVDAHGRALRVDSGRKGDKRPVLKDLEKTAQGVGEDRKSGGSPDPARFQALFDGAPDGTSITALEKVAVSARAPGPTVVPEGLMRDIAEALGPIGEGVSHRTHQGRAMTLDGPCCGIAAPSLAAALKRKGHPVRVVEAEFHVYLIYEGGDDPLIIDPTFRQFFGAERAPKSVPRVFVGRFGDLGRAFDQAKAHRTTKYTPQRIYRSQAFIRDALVADVEDRVAKIQEERPGAKGLLDPVEEADLDAYRPLARTLR